MPVRSSSREVKYTKKGLEYEIDRRQKKFKGGISTWRRQAGHIEGLLCESNDVSALKQERDLLEGDMTSVTNSFEEYNEVLLLADRPSSYEKLELVEKEHYALLKRISGCIAKLLTDVETSSKSHKSSKSSRGSTISRKSSVQKRADAAAEAASLKAKLKYMDREAKQRSDLEKSRWGSAKEAIEGYFLLSSGEAYDEARKLLDERYGDPFIIANVFRDKLDSWPKIPSRDGQALRKFSDFWGQCETATQITGSLDCLHDMRENRKIISKLPDWLVTRWGRKIIEWREAGKGFPKFTEFRKFMIRESNINVSVVHFSGSKVCNKSSLIIPVWLSHRNVPNLEVMTYAMLDTQSDTTFILDSISDELDVYGSDTKLILSTMVSKNQVIDTKRFEGLMVRGIDSSLKIELPPAFSRTMIPANRNHIPTPEIANKWSHLRPIARKLLPLQDCEIGLLIGYNCPRALLPREVIPAVGDGPYGQRTDIGWGVVGIVNPEDIHDSACDPIGLSHKILTYEVPVKSDLSVPAPQRVRISFQSSVREINPVQIIKVLEQDFSEGDLGVDGYSQDDFKFLAILKAGIHQTKDGHYEMPLPFRKPNPMLPSNKELALHRLKRLERRLKSDPTYKVDY
ncbi:hypothetical protein HOLleu_17373 [Holothuria leucospilota]|uniref:Uncharacterized protein n=1 Tax=Holothuria leucospilota TaxID=206669 RepID=A0A9Q1HB83_HOLLE|nr:hypothetical protein HOLleu_17373 [Holothuria leucospilota]